MKTVEKPADGDLEDARGVMLNADGEYVQVLTDTKTWEKFQEKANASKAQAATVEAANKELRERGLECPIDKRMFVDPVKTPCCGKTYCHDCIENALADGDLVCPNCSKDGVLIDDLVTDEEMMAKMRAYEAEKAKEKLDKEQQSKEEAKQAAQPSPPSNNDEKASASTPTDEKAKASETDLPDSSKSPKPDNGSVSHSASSVKSPLTVAAIPATSASTPGAGGNGYDTDNSSTSKKRKEAPTEIKAPTAPKAMRLQKEQQARQQEDQSTALEKNFIESMEALKNMPKNVPGPSMSMSAGMPMNPMMGMMNPQNMNGMNGMNGMNPMGNMNGFNMGGMNGTWNGGYNNASNGYQNQNMYGNMAYQNNGYGNMGYGNMNGMQGNMGGYGGGWNNNQGYGNNMGYGNQAQFQNGNFPNQQRTVFSEQPNQQDAYERKPLNPHRAQNKNRKQRAPDFHYV